LVPAVTTDGANPVLVEVMRGDAVESRHRGAMAIVDADGALVAAWGDVARPVFPRSAVKLLQALPLVESGAADAYRVGEVELALACASHSGEPAHVEAVAAWLARLGLTEADLECGPHPPGDEVAAFVLLRRGAAPGALHNNCSGKHAGFLTTARHLGEPTPGYIRPDHPVQVRVGKAVAEMARIDLAALPTAVDGCGIPTLALPLTALAGAFARVADPADLPEPRRKAVERLRRAVVAQPFFCGGSQRYDTEVIAATGGHVLPKTGAEGVHVAAIPELRIGIALKADDGAKRAAEVMMTTALRALRLLPPAPAVPVRNWAGLKVGEVRAEPIWAADATERLARLAGRT
jgi:L-asparaginase II